MPPHTSSRRASGVPSRVRRLAVVLAASFACTTILVVPAQAAGAPTWSSPASFQPSQEPLNSVSCATASVCVAVGSAQDLHGAAPIAVIERTTNRGITWTPRIVPAGPTSLDGVSCSSKFCVAVGTANGASAIVHSDDMGLTWSSDTPPVGVTGDLVSVSCATTTTCEATGTNGPIIGTSNDGATWTSQSTDQVSMVSCWSASSCIALGSGAFLTSNAGANWTASANGSVSDIGTVSAGACTASAAVVTCYAAGTKGIFKWVTGGSGWVSKNSLASTGALRLQCSTSASCTVLYRATGANKQELLNTGNGGSTWTPVSLDVSNWFLRDFSCISSTCVLVGSANTDSYLARPLAFSFDAKGHPVLGTFQSDFDYANDVTCPVWNSCYAIGTDAFNDPVLMRSTNAGSSWTPLAIPFSFGVPDLITCTSAVACKIVGGTSAASQRGSILLTVNAGASWRAATLPSNTSEILSISCPNTSACFAVGLLTTKKSAIFASVNGGLTWTEKIQPAKVSQLLSISCSSALTCVSGGDSSTSGVGVVEFTKNAGATWTIASVPGDFGNVDSVKCVSTTSCFTSGLKKDGTNGEIAHSLNGGTTWIDQKVPAGVSELYDISCSGALACEAVGYTVSPHGANGFDQSAVVGTVNGGVTWARQKEATPLAIITAVTCAAPTKCLAVGVGIGTGTGAGVNDTNPNDGPGYTEGVVVLRFT